ncbi:plastocyanin/azurin family copper-binding protein [Deinococcus ruber]|uniref:Blue (type 1) copper domain-containing protein n=1 Tax=Deinococcus ruber TaxID=1848197 RepID=A0A918F6Y4_9DEIO|nr:plastocyanin/azurin family copper-binding protein [Deinococcus ruber]GGR07113.1 hypothetical protein GCM10008957_19660 [Deinococcus ruber]
MQKNLLLTLTAGLSLMLAGAPAQAQGAAKPQVVQVKLSEWSMGMEDTKVKGAVQFDVSNVGKFPHVLTIEGKIGGQAFVISSMLLKAGEATSMTVTLPAGTYNVYCPLPGHAARGMVGTLTIE